MIERLMFRAQLKKGMENIAYEVMQQEHEGQRFIDSKCSMTVAGFIFGRDAFLYVEQLTGHIDPEHVVPNLNPLLEDWPGKRIHANGYLSSMCSILMSLHRSIIGDEKKNQRVLVGELLIFDRRW